MDPTYDNVGNILSEKIDATTTHYGYDEAGELCWQGSAAGTTVQKLAVRREEVGLMVQRVGWSFFIVGFIVVTLGVLVAAIRGDSQVVGVMWPFLVFGIAAAVFFVWLDRRKK